MCKKVETRLKLSKSLMCQYSYIGMVLLVLKSETNNIFSLLCDRYVSIGRMYSNFQYFYTLLMTNTYQQLF